MRSCDSRTFRFEGFGLDLLRGCLLGPDGEAELRPKSFEVLCYLVANAGQLAGKDEIIQAVWQSVVVSDASLAQCISEIRLVLHDHDRRMIRTVSRRGYLFAAPVFLSAGPHPPQPASAHQPTAPMVENAALGTFDAVGAHGRVAEQPMTDRSVAAQTAERRRLTVLACEWIGLAGLAARLDPEDLRIRVATYLRRCAEIAGRHHGSVAQMLDDGLLIHFGYPIASEHDAERAVRAGLELLAEPMFSPVTGTPRDAGAEAPLVLRIGVASGLVVIDHEITAGPRQPVAVGAAPHIAKRLLTSAPMGGLVIDHNTRRLVGGWFEYRAAEPIVLDDHAEPVPAWRVTAPSRIESRFEALRDGARSTMAGREEETDMLLRRWQRAQSGEGQVVLICGEAGIGKSWLAAAMLDRIATASCTRSRYSCSPHHTDSALHPILRQLEAAAGVATADEAPARLAKLNALLARTQAPAEDHAALVDLFAAATPGRPPALAFPPQQRRRQILDAITRRFEADSRRQPLLAVFEDVQWIDPTSLDALGRIIDRVATLPALLIATFRPEFAPPWVGAPHVTLLTLGRLCHRDCRDLVARTAAGRPIRGELANEIVARSDGVPLFVEELTKSALDEADTFASAGMALARAEPNAATRPADRPMPASLHALLAARLDRLGPARELAQIGAVIGRTFALETLAAVTGRSATELTEQLDRLVETGLVLRQGQSPDVSFLFKHALIQDAAYGTLLRETRRALHGQIAAALEAGLPHIRSNEPEILARHYFEAGLLPQAVMRWIEAGDLAVRRAALEEAVAHLSTAIEVADRAAEDGAPVLSDGARLNLQTAYGQTLLWARDMREATAAFARARELAAQLDDPSQRLDTYCGLWAGSLMSGELAAAGEIADTLMRDWRACPGAVESAVAYRVAGTTLWHVGDFAGARRHLEQMPECGPTLRFGADIRIAASVVLGASLWLLGELDQARRQLEHAMAHAAASSHALTLVYVHIYSLIIEMTRGDVDRALALTRTHVELCSKHRLTHGAYADICATWVRWRSGARQGVLAEMRRSVGQLPEHCRLGRPWCLSLLAELEMSAGDLDASLATIDAALAETRRTGEHWYLAELHRLRGEILLARDRTDTASAQHAFHNALAVARQQNARSLALRAALSLAKLYAASGRNPEVHDALAPALAGFAPTPELPEIELARALIARFAASRTTAARRRTAGKPASRHTTTGAPRPRGQ